MFLLFIIIAVIILVLLTKIEIKIKIIFKNGTTNYSFIELRVFKGLLSFRFKLLSNKLKNTFHSILKKTDSSLHKNTSLEEVFKLLKRNYNQLSNNGNVGKYIFSKIEIKNLSLNLEIGTGDAAQTAIISGAIVILFKTAESYIRNRYQLGPQPLRVFPHFERKAFNMDLGCIIYIRIGHIIIAGIRIIGKKIKGGEKNGGTSN